MVGEEGRVYEIVGGFYRWLVKKGGFMRLLAGFIDGW